MGSESLRARGDLTWSRGKAVNAATTDVTNAGSEGLNSKIQWVKRMACGYRNRRRFHNAI
ncbi:MAG: transposase [Deltaproteobacteria bacterium]|nr:transposase [Deltaproteobacteria bacterium]